MKYLLFLPICLFSIVCSAQSKKFTFQLGSEYELPRKSEDLAFFGNDKDGIVNLSIKKEELNIVRFNTSALKKTFENRIDLVDATRNFVSEVVTDFSTNSYYWIHSDWDRSNEKEMLFYDKIDVTTGKLADVNHKLFETTKMAGTAEGRGFYNFKTTGKYQYNYDADRKKLLVSYRLAPEERNDKKNYDKIGFQVFDENMKKLWGNEFTMPYTEAVMDNSDFSIDGNGNVYLLAKVYDSDSRKERDKSTGKPAYHFEVLKFTKDSKKITIAPISVGDFFIREITLTENSLHEMIVASTYSKWMKGNSTDGISLAILDQSGKLVKYKNGYYEFPKDELEKFESARSQRKIERKEDYEINNLKVRDIMLEADGSIFISCEQYHVETNTYTDSRGMMHTSFTYYYDDIYGCKINSAGKFEWLRKIPKRQRGTRGRGTMSFKLISDASGYYFLYLDNLKNLNIKEDEEPKTHADGYGGQVIVSRLTPDGNLSKELLFDTRDEDVMIFPADFSRIEGNRFIGRARLKRNLYQPILISAK